MNHHVSKKYLGFSHAKYMENDPVQYDLKANELILTTHQQTHFHDDVELLFILDGEAILYVNFGK
ncbi:MAG: hypothetical protein PHY47_12060 [Lachnospiraceae bacterium]|nr:hypothetical protein [Lachnospiraceae bacterium]